MGADHKGCRVLNRKGSRPDVDPIIGAVIVRQVDDGRGYGSVGCYRDEPRRSGDFATGVVRRLGVVCDSKIRRFRTVDDLNPNRRRRRIVGEADDRLSLPRRSGDLERRLIHGDARLRTGRRIQTGNDASENQGDRRGENLETQHDRYSDNSSAQQAAYGWQSLKKSRYLRVDDLVMAESDPRSGGPFDIVCEGAIGQGFGEMQPADLVGAVEVRECAGDAEDPVIAACR